MEAEKIKEILEFFDSSQYLYRDFSESVSNLLSTLMLEHSIQVHSVTHRCKSRQSLEKKISRPDKDYSSLSEITDVVGVRITTYFSDDVDKIAELISQEFVIDPAASVDKRKYDQPDRFGYLSLHYIATLPDERARLSEYRRFSKLRFEIQIRSILQHAWAEIEHDLGYKTAIGVPPEIRRRFARVAGLLELADDEFLEIRKTLGALEKELPRRIHSAPFAVDLNLTSLRALFDAESYTKKLDVIVADAGKCSISSQKTRAIDETDVERLRFFGIYSIGQLEDVARNEADLVGNFTKYWLRSPSKLNPGIGIFYLCYVLAWKTGSAEKIKKYLASRGIGKINERDELVSRILNFHPG